MDRGNNRQSDNGDGKLLRKHQSEFAGIISGIIHGENTKNIYCHVAPGEGEGMKHQGLFSQRLANNPRERAFAEQWEIENKLYHALNFLVGVGDAKEITDRDIEVAATVIQWLGSNVGMSFLSEVIKKEAEVAKFFKKSFN